MLLISEFLPDRTAAAILRGVDAIVLPYRQTEESSSAALRFVLPIERPIIATDLPIFDDAEMPSFWSTPTTPPVSPMPSGRYWLTAICAETSPIALRWRHASSVGSASPTITATSTRLLDVRIREIKTAGSEPLRRRRTAQSTSHPG